MVLMALDHTRDFFGNSGANPRDLADPALFLTRWITHFCAPTFIFLAGVSAWLYGSQGRTIGQVSRFLLTRGLFLIAIEFTIVRFGWSFSLDLNHFAAQVIWVIGASMVALAVLVYLPSGLIAAVALIMIAGHNLLDPIRASDFGSFAFLWNFLHEPGLLRIGPDRTLFVLYPLIPWIGVMASGYALGPVFGSDHVRRRRCCSAWERRSPSASSCCAPPISMAIRRASSRSRISCRQSSPSSIAKNTRRRCSI